MKRSPASVAPLASRRRRWPIVVAVVALMAAAGALWFAWELPSWLASRDLRRALAAGRYEEAWKGVDRWLRDRPNSAEAHYLRAKAAIALGRRADFADSLRRAQVLGYPAGRLALLRALIDAQFGRLAQAQPVLAKAFAEASEPDPMVDEALARVYLEVYDFAHASAVLTRWAKDIPDDPRPPFWHAEANKRRDAEPEAILADYQEVLKRDPNHAEARLGIADQLTRAHRDREAADAYASYLAIRPDDPAGHLGAGRAALALGDEEAAALAFEAALTRDPGNAAAHLERAKIDVRRNDPASALAHLDKAAASTPFDPAVHYQRALALKRLGKAEEGAREQAEFARLSEDRRKLDDLQALLAERPTDATLQNGIARWMFDHGYEKEGVHWAKKVLLDHPGHPATCALLAAHYERLGQWDQAQFYKTQAGRRQ